MKRPPRLIAAVAAVSLLAGCADLTREGRIGGDDGDTCRTQLVALDSTGNFFAEDIIQGAAIGAVTGGIVGGIASGNWRGALIGAGVGAVSGGVGGYLAALQRRNQDQASLRGALANDLAAENVSLDRTQLAFDQLMDCRFKQAEQVRMAHRRGALPREAAQARMADLRARTGRDIALAQRISGTVRTRGDQFDTAIETVTPGVKNQVLASRGSGASVSARPPREVILRLRPDPNSPEVGRVAAQSNVTARPARQGYALVSANGQAGYAETRALGAPRLASVPPPPAASGGDVRQLAAGNIARREGFTESITTAQAAASGGGFELT